MSPFLFPPYALNSHVITTGTYCTTVKVVEEDKLSDPCNETDVENRTPPQPIQVGKTCKRVCTPYDFIGLIICLLIQCFLEIGVGLKTDSEHDTAEWTEEQICDLGLLPNVTYATFPTCTKLKEPFCFKWVPSCTQPPASSPQTLSNPVFGNGDTTYTPAQPLGSEPLYGVAHLTDANGCVKTFPAMYTNISSNPLVTVHCDTSAYTTGKFVQSPSYKLQTVSSGFGFKVNILSVLGKLSHLPIAHSASAVEMLTNTFNQICTCLQTAHLPKCTVQYQVYEYCCEEGKILQNNAKNVSFTFGCTENDVTHKNSISITYDWEYIIKNDLYSIIPYALSLFVILNRFKNTTFLLNIHYFIPQ